MPNGGSDCCGTGWFNEKNQGEAGYAHALEPGPSHCVIRNLPIDNPFYTYCGNHPQRRPDRDPVPIGPVFTGDSFGTRVVWRDSPDNEEVRIHLLELLQGMNLESVEGYPIGPGTAETVIRQLGQFREKRATLLLQSLITAQSKGSAPGSLVEHARQALEKME